MNAIGNSNNEIINSKDQNNKQATPLRQKYVTTIGFWFGVLLSPLGLAIAIVRWYDLSVRIYLPILILGDLLLGTIVYAILLTADIKGLKETIKQKEKMLQHLKKEKGENNNGDQDSKVY